MNTRLEEAALTTALALGEVARHWDAVYDAMRRADRVDKEISSERDHELRSKWPCWPEPRPKAHRAPTRLAREVRSLGKQSSTRRASTGRASVPQGGDRRGGIDPATSPLRPAMSARARLREAADDEWQQAAVPPSPPE